MVLPTTAILDDAHQLRRFFESKFFGDPFGLKTVDEALEDTWNFFVEARFSAARGFLNFIVHKSVEDIQLRADTVPVPALFFRIHENFVLFEVSVSKRKMCTFDDADVRRTCAELYTRGERMKPNPERAASWSRGTRLRGFLSKF